MSAISNQTVNEVAAITQINAQDDNSSADTDIDLEALTYTCTYNGGSPCGGLAGFSLDASTGVMDWTPSYTQAGVYNFILTASEGDLTDTETFTITVNDVDLPPELSTVSDETVNENVAITSININDTNTSNDTDRDGDTITYTCQVNGSGCGTVSGISFTGATGAMDWTPSFSQAGTYNFVITGSEGDLNDTESFTITVSNIDRAPELFDISDFSVAEGSAITQVNNRDLHTSDDTDRDGDTITYTCQVNGSGCGTVAGVSFVGATGTVDWTPSYTQAGTYDFVITGSEGDLDDTEAFRITVTNTNRAPVLDAIADETVAENSAITAINAADGGDDLDIDLEDIDYTCAVDSAASCVALGVTFDTDTGDLSWTPGFSDAGTHNFTITGSDGSLSDDETFTITVTNNNRAPVLDAIADETVSENSAITAINAADGGDDLDIDNDDIDYTCAVDSAASCVALGVTFDTDTGDLSWTPGFSDAGTHNFTITGSDGSLSDDETFTITVNNTNRAPVLDAIADETVSENSAITAINAADGGDDLDIDNDDIDYTCAVDSAASCVALGVTFDTDSGDLSWTPSFDDAGTHNFTITGSDGSLSDDETFTITVNNTNRAPVLDAISNQTVSENSAITAINAADGGDDLDIDSDDIDYTCAVDSAASCVALGVTFDTDTGDLSWTPGFDDAGTHNFTITGSDGSLSDDETFTITVTNTNRPPVLSSISDIAGNELIALTSIDADDTGDDQDADAEALLYSCTFDTNIDSSVAAGTTCSQANLGGTFSFNTTTGVLDWTPGSNAYENGDASGRYEFQIVADDQQGAGNSTDSEIFMITIADNIQPAIDTIADDSVAENSSLATINAADGGDDLDGDSQALLYSCTYDLVANNDVSAGTTCSQANLGGTFSFNTSTGVMDWTPDFDGAGTYEFQIVADDQQGAGNSTDNEIFVVTVTNTNRAPVLDAISNQTIAENAAMTQINAADGGDDNDIDLEDIDYTCAVDSAASCVALGATFDAANGVLDWTPSFTQAGTHNFTITGSDGSLSDDETFTITVTNTNRPPVLDAISNQTVAENSAITAIDAADGGDDNDVDLQDIDYTCAVDSAASCVALGVTFDTNNGTLAWTPGYDNAGTHNFTITGSDGSLSDDETFAITVTNTNRAPVLDAIANETVAENSAITAINAADGGDDLDVDNDDIDYTCAVDSAATCVALGVTFDTDTGDLSWTPSFTDAGTHNFTITGSDGSLSDDETFTITVNNTNRAPVLDAIANETVAENAAITAINAADGGDDLDIDNDDIDYTCAVDSAASCVALGVTFDTDTGDLSWTPGFSDAGTHNFTITGSDGSLSDDETFTITVNNTNRAPVLDAIPDETVSENSAITAVNVADGGDDLDVDNDDIDYTCAVDSAVSCVALGVTFDTDSGDLSWTPGYDDAGTHNFTITGSDGSLSDDETFTITVNNTNRAPVLDAIADETVSENSAITAIDAADGGDDNDADGQDIDYTCTVDSAASCVALGVTFDTDNGTLSWTPGFTDAGTHNFTITGSDGSLSDDETFTITVNNTNRAPVLDSISNQTVAENSAITAINAADGGDDLDIDLQDIDYTCAVDSAASCVALGVTFDTDSGDLSWTPGFSDAGTHNFTITGSDGSLSDDETFTITVTNVNRAPVLDAIADETVVSRRISTRRRLNDYVR